MTCRVLLASLAVGLLASGPLLAQDEIWIRGQEKPIKGVIKTATPKGAIVGKELIPAETIVDVTYELTPLEVRLTLYRPAIKLEKDANDPINEKDRKKLLTEAMKKYEEASAKVAEKDAKRHLEYKVAILMARLAQEDNAAPDAALAKLKGFADAHPQSWQIASVLKTMAQLQLAQKDYAAAEATYRKLADLDVADDIKQEAELSALQTAMQGGSKTAGQELEKLIAKLPKTSLFSARARVLQAESMLATKDNAQADKAVVIIRDIIKTATDPAVKADAHNALGIYFFNRDQYKDARWEFLWVDVIYNQDRAAHAKALYYLWQTFEKLGELELAQESRETLLSERQFTGLEYQRMAQREAKAPR